MQLIMSEEEQSQFKSLLSDFKDAFACSDFSFMSFTALELEIAIDTGYAAPIKEKIWQALGFFAGK